MATSDGILTSGPPVLRVASDIRGSYAIASRREVADTLFDNSYLGLIETSAPATSTARLPGTESTDPAYWSMARSQIRKALRLIGQAVAEEEVTHLSIFAIAPVPALVLLGGTLDDKVETRISAEGSERGLVLARRGTGGDLLLHRRQRAEQRVPRR